METGAVLIGLAQIGVALAGITTIASVIVKTSQTTSRNLFIVRVLSILLYSLGLILSALMPVLVSSAGMTGLRLWQVSAMLSMPSWIGLAVIGFFYVLPRALRDEKNNWVQSVVLTVIPTAGFGCAVYAIFSDQAEFFYMLSLMAVLTANLIAMTALILSFPIFERLFLEEVTNDKK
ncbi:MAG: hypothetical protein EX271_01740 [Acidimicrobiales bacterium]|nr:hypothetical protein [Hyphomonadaceae bacterium]RZV44434.1 MAG: hypothetical protein EX271_01740 [Acidimicrobiales bacterium]